jgi:hypothetical protein
MKYDPDIHHRRSIRLKGYDYSQAGAYFVTICANDRECLFGNVTDGEMRLNDAGRMVQTVWDELPVHYANIDIDISQIMPNHFHGIIIVGVGPCACPNNKDAQKGQPHIHEGQPHTQERQSHIQKGQPRRVAPTGLSLPDMGRP